MDRDRHRPDQHSYTAPGENHTLLSQDAFHSHEVEGVAFVDWVSDLVSGIAVDDVRCTDCGGEEPTEPEG